MNCGILNFASRGNSISDNSYQFNFGLSALAGVGENPESRRLERVLNYLYQHLNKFYNFKGLHAYKDKFRPRWESRYLVYPSLTAL